MMLHGNTATIINLSPADLFSQIRDIVKQEVIASTSEQLKEQLLSPEKTRALFNPAITRQTLARWTKDGLLQAHYIGGRVYYKYSEVIESVMTLKRYNKTIR